MRLILEDKARDVMSYLDKLLEDEQLNPFLFEIRNCRILSGEEEGAFMWIAANYLRGFFTHSQLSLCKACDYCLYGIFYFTYLCHIMCKL